MSYLSFLKNRILVASVGLAIRVDTLGRTNRRNSSYCFISEQLVRGDAAVAGAHLLSQEPGEVTASAVIEGQA